MNHLETKWSHAAALLVMVLAAPLGRAQAQAEPPKPEHQLTFNASVVSEYRYRGISQSRLDPAVQGGADYVHNPTGFYAGTWLSTISWIRDLGGDSEVEWDIFGGKKGQITPQLGYDVGGLYYFYPDNNLGPNANTFELYGQLSYGPGYVKYSHATTNLFGTPNSRHSGYLDVGANVELPVAGLVLNLHAGRQDVHHHSALSYNDYKLGLTKDFGIASVQLAFVKATGNGYLSPAGKFLGRPSALLTISRTF